MRYLLDANVVISILRDAASGPARRVRRERFGDVAVSAIVTHELFYGAFKSRRTAENVEIVDALRFPVVEFNREDARHAGEIRAYLAGKGTAIGPYDVLVAGQAISRNMVLVTHNTREFAQVPHLTIEDWEV